MDLRGSVVLLTGAAGGIGRALARAFGSEGAEVVGADLPGSGADLSLDVTDPAACAGAVAAVLDRAGRLDVVLAGAGIGVAGVIDDLDPEDFQRSLRVNVDGTINTVLAAYPVLRAQRRGAIVLLSSLSGLLGTPILAPYATAKAALVGLGASLRPEAARVGVGVTVVCPGPIDTALLDAPAQTAGVQVRRYLTAAAGPARSPDWLAGHVVDGVRRNRALVVPGRAGLLWRAQRLAPGFVASQLAKRMDAELRPRHGVPAG